MGRMLYSESTKKLTASLTHSSLAPSGGVVAFKRPYGVAVLEIGDMMATPGSEEREFMFKVRIPPWLKICTRFSIANTYFNGLLSGVLVLTQNLNGKYCVSSRSSDERHNTGFVCYDTDNEV
jgi:hypothetical protein